MVSADKGTAVKDGDRQAIIANHILMDVYPVESLVSVACIYAKTALGAAEYLISICQTLQTKKCNKF